MATRLSCNRNRNAMQINLNADSLAILKAFRDSFKSGDFTPGRKTFVNAFLKIAVIKSAEVLPRLNWDMAHFLFVPRISLQLNQEAEKELNSLVTNANQYLTRPELPATAIKDITTRTDMAVARLIAYAGSKLTDRDFRMEVIECLRDPKQDPRQILLDFPEPLYVKLVAVARRKDRSVESLLQEMFNERIIQLDSKDLRTMAARASAQQLFGNQMRLRFAKFEVHEEIKQTLSTLDPFSVSIINLAGELAQAAA